jgi:ABC-type sulfate/molybdate transport systems ATPase subunit
VLAAGQHHRITVALASNPEFIVWDAPSAALDVSVRRKSSPNRAIPIRTGCSISFPTST